MYDDVIDDASDGKKWEKRVRSRNFQGGYRNSTDNALEEKKREERVRE